jgi:hypothetical protein
MNNLILQIDAKPLSVNAKFTLNKYRRRIVKSTAAIKFEKVVESNLVKHKSELDIFKLNYNRSKHGLQLEIVMYVPESEFFTKEGLISSTCIDAGNALKMLEDIIYKSIGINDGWNVKVSSEKRPHKSEKWITLVNISEVPIPKSCYLDDKILSMVNKTNG